MPVHQFLSTDSARNHPSPEVSVPAGVLYKSPANWPLEETPEGRRDRRFIRLADRPTGFETDFACLERTLHQIVPRQQQNGCFLSSEEILLPDKSDDHLGVAGMLAYYLSLTEENPDWNDALGRGLRYQIDHLCATAPNTSGRYVRYYLERDSPLDWCNTLWSLQGLNFVLEFGQPFLPRELYREALELGRDFWEHLTNYPARDENPCHNQLLEYASIGYTYGRISARPKVCQYVLDYYKSVLRKLRIEDSGRWIYTEFNRWCAHYALLSWYALEHLWVESGESLFEEDAMEMAAAFNDRISAGGYYFGGSRRDEPGYETFLYQFWLRGQVFNFDRLLLPEPSDQWRDLIYDGHNGRSLVSEMMLFAKQPSIARTSLSLSVYTLYRNRCSVRFNENGTSRHISVNGLELIEANLPDSLNSPLLWKQNGNWVEDSILAKPPPPSPLHRYGRVLGQSFSGVELRATMQRGSDWEIRTWWITDGHRLQGIAHLIAHNAVRSDQVKFVLGNPCLTETEGVVKPVFSVSNSDCSVNTFGPQQSLRSVDFLRIGDQYIRASTPMQFVRPSEDAFDGFPARNRKLWSKQKDSNRIEIVLSETSKQFHFRESLFVGMEIGGERTPPEVFDKPGIWTCGGKIGRFEATEVEGNWSYSFKPEGTKIFQLSNPAFGHA
ncbi:hypothetical protein [Puniceicoccus vermicola]|uniref:Uncharacterized protein n=1 Tax=Puniceicoccus vermicola TaxID=388746 RepID=A0A7X1E4N7_9BACT|nr:hypothetical protein [Puniceicoccus vermicola]MBC2602720.1 hypothetical protein [Puniceicoccus vermicola]